jgi:hypothetical protein
MYDTSRCPLGHRCESCGAEGRGLRVKAAPTALGVLCLTLCPRCASSPVPPPITVDTAGRLANQHRAHLEGTR